MQRSKSLWLLIAAQGACIAVGLGVHYLYVTATVSTEAEEDARAALATVAQPLVTSLQSAIPAAGELAGPAFDPLKSVLAAVDLPAEARLTLLDRNWNIVSQRNSSDLGLVDSTDAEIGFDKARWVEGFQIAGKPVRGLLPSADGAHVAIGYMLGQGDAYLIAHRPVAQVQLSLEVLTPSLLTAGAITFVWTCGLLGIAVYMIVSHDHDKISKSKLGPEVEALKRAQALVRTQETVIFALAKLSDSRDGDTGDHLERISFYCSSLATALRQHPKYRDVVTPAFVQLIGISSALHDIGKVGVEDAILRKPGLLTKEEFDRMKRHTTVGEECLKEIERRLGTTNFLKMAREIASFHHERWDGKGYPYGLRGEQIPLAARITAIADVYDALSSKRVYKDAYSHEKCVAIIRDDAGKHFDPVLVEVFLQIESTFLGIARRFGSGDCFDESLSESESVSASEKKDELAVAAAAP